MKEENKTDFTIEGGLLQEKKQHYMQGPQWKKETNVNLRVKFKR